MITRLIRKLLGRTSADATSPKADADTAVSPRPQPALATAAPAKKAARRSKRPAAPAPAVRDPKLPEIVQQNSHGIDPALISRNAVRVTSTLQEAGHRAFIVGGAVRDLLLGVSPKDFDVATDATPDQVQRLFRRARIIGRRFQIVHVQFGADIIEVSTFRGLVDPALPTADSAGAALPAAARGATATEARPGRSAAATTVEPLRRAKAEQADDDGGSSGDSDEFDDQDDAADGEQPGNPSAGRGSDIARFTTEGGSRNGGRRRRKRDDLDQRTHAVDESGRVLRDNVWGEQHEDARRRDFTINAMYYDPATETVLDYHEGMSDIRARVLRMIGDPNLRFREDPVRMLRVVRFAAKLGFSVDPATRAPIAELSSLIDNVPAARLFDEVLKLMMSGHSLACLKQLRTEGLHHTLLPTLDTVLETPQTEKFVALALTSTDLRIRAGKPVSPGFLFAALLWHDVHARWQRYLGEDAHAIPALHQAMDEALYEQTRTLAIQKRYAADMKEIWGMQPRLEKVPGRGALKLLEHQRFRAAYDFLLLRCESGELDAAIGQWWTDFIAADGMDRESLLSKGGRERAAPRRRRKRPAAGTRQADEASGSGADVAAENARDNASDHAADVAGTANTSGTAAKARAHAAAPSRHDGDEPA
ncbi:MAG: polynucleotide adenylyltransferase PcnB [Janthinobacterium lividum]